MRQPIRRAAQGAAPRTADPSPDGSVGQAVFQRLLSAPSCRQQGPAPGNRTSGEQNMRRRTRMAGVLAAMALALGLTLAGAGAARADVIPPSGWSEIYSPYLHASTFSLCFDDTNGSTASGNPVQLYHCHGYASNGAPQRWVFIQPEDNAGNLIYDQGHPVYEIYNLAAGQCLTAQNLLAGRPDRKSVVQGKIV